MRITKGRLTQIIKEEARSVNEMCDDLTTLQGSTPQSVAQELAEAGIELSDESIAQAAVEAGVLDDDLSDFVDAVWDAADFQPRSSFGIPHAIGEQRIKITKKQLTQIIKEELEATLAEELPGDEVEEQLNEVDPSVLADPSVIEVAKILMDAAAQVGIELLMPAATLAILASKGSEAVEKVRGVEDEEF